MDSARISLNGSRDASRTGRGAWCIVRSGTVRVRGRYTSDSAGISSDNGGENPPRRKSKVS